MRGAASSTAAAVSLSRSSAWPLRVQWFAGRWASWMGGRSASTAMGAAGALHRDRVGGATARGRTLVGTVRRHDRDGAGRHRPVGDARPADGPADAVDAGAAAVSAGRSASGAVSGAQVRRRSWRICPKSCTRASAGRWPPGRGSVGARAEIGRCSDLASRRARGIPLAAFESMPACVRSRSVPWKAGPIRGRPLPNEGWNEGPARAPGR